MARVAADTTFDVGSPRSPQFLSGDMYSVDASPKKVDLPGTISVDASTFRSSVDRSSLESNISYRYSAGSYEVRIFEQHQWQWSHHTGWRDYLPQESDRIEAAFRKGDAYVRLKSGKSGHVPMEVFFYDMIQYDPKTNNKRNIRCDCPHPLVHQIKRFLNLLCRSLEKGRWQRISFDEHQELKQGRQVFKQLDRHNVFEKYHERGYAQMIAKSSMFFCLSMLAVTMNAIWIGIDAEYNDSPTVLKSDVGFQLPEHFFSAYFLFEISVRFAAFRKKKRCLSDYWFCFDAALVGLIMFEIYVLPLFYVGKDMKNEDHNLKNMALLRLVRLLRLTQLFRLLQFKELLTLTKGLLQAFRSVGATLILLLILIYVFAIIFKLRAEHEPGLPNELYSVAGCMKTLLLQGTFVDDVTEVLDQIYPISPLLFFLFIAFIFMSSYAVLNLLIGVLCDVVHRVRKEELNDTLVMSLKETLFEILECHDKDNDQRIDPEEWDLIMENPEMHMILKQCDVSIASLKELKDLFFYSKQATKTEEWAEEPSQPSMDFDDMLQGILRLRGTTTATVQDIVDLREYIKDRLDGLHYRIRKDPASQAVRSWLGANLSRDLNTSREITLSRETSGHSLRRDFSPPDHKRDTTPVLSPGHNDVGDPVRPSADHVTPQWATDILDRLNSLAAKHDGLRDEVAELRSQLRSPSERVNLSARGHMDVAMAADRTLGRAFSDGPLHRASDDGNHCRAAVPGDINVTDVSQSVSTNVIAQGSAIVGCSMEQGMNRRTCKTP